MLVTDEALNRSAELNRVSGSHAVLTLVPEMLVLGLGLEGQVVGLGLEHKVLVNNRRHAVDCHS